MLRKAGFLVAVCLVVLAVLLVFLGGGETQQIAAAHQEPAWWTQEISHTLFLPLAVRYHDPTFVSPFGVIMYGSVSDAAGLQAMQAAGTKWVTTKLKWSSIEPSKGVYDWSSFDTKAQNAQAAGIDVFVLFGDNPTWAAELPGGPVYDVQDLVDFVTIMAERYDCDGVDDAPGSPCVHNWSFYAEPDNGDLAQAERGKGYWGHDGDGYAAMLWHVSPAIHGANPRAQVLIGGLAYDWFEEDGGPFVRSFLADTLTALNALGGAEKYIDGVPFHYYPISAGRWATIREKSAEIQAIMANNGAGTLPLLCPEMGYWSSPCLDDLSSSEKRQAQRLVQMYVRGLSANISVLSWYKVSDDAVACTVDDLYPDRTSGLLRVDGSVKASYHAYETMTGELTGLRYWKPLQAAGAEGYVFRMADGKTKTVLWSPAGTVYVAFPHTYLRVVTILGDEVDIWDNQTGDMDGGVVGQITLAIFENEPFFVEPQ
jgi:hypothetical protein